MQCDRVTKDEEQSRALCSKITSYLCFSLLVGTAYVMSNRTNRNCKPSWVKSSTN